MKGKVKVAKKKKEEHRLVSVCVFCFFPPFVHALMCLIWWLLLALSCSQTLLLISSLHQLVLCFVLFFFCLFVFAGFVFLLTERYSLTSSAYFFFSLSGVSCFYVRCYRQSSFIFFFSAVIFPIFPSRAIVVFRVFSFIIFFFCVCMCLPVRKYSHCKEGYICVCVCVFFWGGGLKHTLSFPWMLVLSQFVTVYFCFLFCFFFVFYVSIANSCILSSPPPPLFVAATFHHSKS